MQPNTSDGTVPSQVVEHESIIAPLHKVTPVSKYLALALFIALPFVGGVVGYNLASENVAEAPVRLTVDNNPSAAPSVDTSSNSVYVPTVLQRKNEFQYPADELRYVNINQDTSDFWGNRYNYANSSVIDDVTYVDVDSKNVASMPFLRILMVTPDGYILTLPCFIESECGDGGLFKYNKTKKEVSTMEGSHYYYPMMTGDYRSPDGSKIAVTHNFTLGVIDVINDTYTELKKLDFADNKTFTICEMGCYSEVSWKSNTELIARVFEFESCEQDGMCQSTYTNDRGESGPSTIPIASSTLQFSI